jgi:tryptophan 2,3-dioxygenase
MTGQAGTYRAYLQLGWLLSLQCPVTPAGDASTRTAEHFFITCHQASELWAKQIFLDLDHAAAAARSGDWSAAQVSLTRAAALVTMVRQTLTTLLYLPVADFHRFRDRLAGTSGAESEQFNTLLQASRLQPVRSLQRSLAVALPPEGAHAEGSCPHEECATARALRSLVAGVAVWRRRHAVIARHFIGSLPGTGGSTGVSYLLRDSGASRPSARPGRRHPAVRPPARRAAARRH